MRHALVTGATGFIGHHLVQRLLAQGTAVKCLVRSKSRADHLSQLGVTLVQGELEDVSSLSEAVKDADVVYHLAGVTKSVRKSDLMRVNGDGTKNLSLVCSRRNCPPTLVLVSSLAAAGPSTGSEPRIETDPVSPVSCYGRSKRAGELAVMDFADELPVTIVRPPIVFGEHDRDVFQWFRSIDKLGLHFAAGLRDFHYSLIHATLFNSTQSPVQILTSLILCKHVAPSPPSPLHPSLPLSFDIMHWASADEDQSAQLHRRPLWIMDVSKRGLFGIIAQSQTRLFFS